VNMSGRSSKRGGRIDVDRRNHSFIRVFEKEKVGKKTASGKGEIGINSWLQNRGGGLELGRAS